MDHAIQHGQGMAADQDQEAAGLAMQVNVLLE